MAQRHARNLLSGETMTFRQTSPETGGDVIELDLELRPLGAPGALPHRHLPEERFEIASGLLYVWIAGRPPTVARRGDVVVVPPGRWHYIVALRSTHARVVIRPGMHFDELLQTMAAVGSGDLRPGTLRRLAPLLREHGCI
ncbi:MAG: cupin domain-containing protein [Solirubrobacteraceae bacterium]|jgi:mannose-6-phosphate isomerase-like protein (cupin superfamily)